MKQKFSKVLLVFLIVSLVLPLFNVHQTVFADEKKEDFTDGQWHESDPLNQLSQTQYVSTFTDVAKEDSCYLYKDKGAGFFNLSTDFEHLFDFTITASGGGTGASINLWGLWNSLGDYFDVKDISDGLAVFYYHSSAIARKIKVRIVKDATVYDSSYTDSLTVDTTYYAKVNWTASTSTLGFYIYTDAARTSLFANVSKSQSGVDDLRYIMCPQSIGATSGTNMSGHIDNLALSAEELAQELSFSLSASIQPISALDFVGKEKPYANSEETAVSDYGSLLGIEKLFPTSESPSIQAISSITEKEILLSIIETTSLDSIFGLGREMMQGLTVITSTSTIGTFGLESIFTISETTTLVHSLTLFREMLFNLLSTATSTSAISLKKEIYALQFEYMVLNTTSNLVWGKETLFTASAITALTSQLQTLREMVFDLLTTATSTSTITFGKETIMVEFEQAITQTVNTLSQLHFFKEIAYSLAELTQVLANLAWGKEAWFSNTASAALTSTLQLFKEAIFNLPHSTVLNAVSTFTKEAGLVIVEILQTIIASGTIHFTIEEVSNYATKSFVFATMFLVAFIFIIIGAVLLLRRRS